MLLLTAALVGSLVGAAPSLPLAAAKPGKHQVWSPSALPKAPSVPGKPAGSRGAPHPSAATVPQPQAAAAAAPVWPATGGIQVDTTAAKPDAPVRAGNSPVWVAAAHGRPPAAAAAAGVTSPDAGPAPQLPAKVSVQPASQAQAKAAGIAGVLVSVTRADGSTGSGAVRIGLDDKDFAQAYGGSWASRLRWVQLPGCVLTTPQNPDCRRQTPLATQRNAATGRLEADVALGGAAPRATSDFAVPDAASAPMVVLAATAAPAGSTGSFTATSVKSSDSWGTDGNTGGFSYSYPIAVPPAVGGAAPNVSLSYDSGDADGQTAAANNQTGQLGQGWSWAPGFIERSYIPCASDNQPYSPDLCYGKQNATLSLAGHSGTLVLDDTSKVWKIQGDDGTQIQQLFGDPFGANGDHDGEYWVITTTDGTRYYFGAGHVPTGTGKGAASNSVWTEPVYGADAGTPCHAATFLASVCTKAWRWNLDYVLDTDNNLTSYQYATETNYFTTGYTDTANGSLTSYVRGGYPVSISYGQSLAEAAAGSQPAAKVGFTVAERCLAGATACNPANLSSNATTGNWPDVPSDQICASTGPCSNYSPSFFTTKMITQVSTQALVSGSYLPVDSYQLTYQFADPNDTPGRVIDQTGKALWLSSIQHTATDGQSALSTAPVVFYPTELDNRVAGLSANGTAMPPFRHPRMWMISTETGETTTVNYSKPQCNNDSSLGTVAMPSAPGTDTMLCFQQTWVPKGMAPVADWFNKYVVTSVVTSAGKSGLTSSAFGTSSPDHVTSYTYGGLPAWHTSDNELDFTPGSTPTWDQFRGYPQVTTTTGDPNSADPLTKTVASYLRGMDQDLTITSAGASSKPLVFVTDSLGATGSQGIQDDVALAGTLLESDEYQGSTVVSKTVTVPWLSGPTAQHARPTGNLPTVRARIHGVASTQTAQLLAGGGWRTGSSVYTHDALGRQTTVDDRGDGTSAAPETCTTTSYTAFTNQPQWQSFPSEKLTVTGGCATAPSATTTISDTRTFYGPATPGTGASVPTVDGSVPPDVRFTQVIDHYDTSGNPVYVTTSASAYDGYGRATTVTDVPTGQATTTAYSPATGALPTSVTVTNAAGWSSTTTMDPARNLPLHKADANGRVTDETYDALGRLTAVWTPDRKKATQTPTKKFSYLVPTFTPSTPQQAGGPTTPIVVQTETLREDGSYAEGYAFYDSMMQSIQTQTTAADASANGWIFTDTDYDSHGWARGAHQPFYNNTAQAGVAQNFADASVPGSTTTVYDGLGRALSTTFWAHANPQWKSSTVYRGADETDTNPPVDLTGGATAATVAGPVSVPPTTAITDVQGRTTETWVYHQGVTTATGNRSDADVTSYGYTPAGQRASVTDPTGRNTWTWSYDLRGRLVSQSDPDAGTSSTSFNAKGQVDHTVDARGQAIYFAYNDPLGRKTAEYANAANGPQLAAWSYDGQAKGYPSSSTRYSGGATYTSSVTGYTADYQPTGSTLTISAPGANADAPFNGTYQTNQGYTPVTERLDHTDYPAAGPLPAETVSYQYNANGLLLSAGGTYDYLTQQSYDYLGRAVRTTLGDMPLQAVQTTIFDDSTGRRLTDIYDKENGSASVDKVGYLYNQAGKMTAVTDTPDSGPTDTQCFGYDYAGRLATAWSDTGTRTSGAAPASAVASLTANSPVFSVAGIGGCLNGQNPPTAGTAKYQIGGPAPYWTSYSYDQMGDRLSDVTHDVTGTTSRDTTRSYAYPAAGSARPHASTGTTVTTGLSVSNDSYQYDAAGNTVTRTLGGGGGQPAANQTITWDAEGHLASVADQTSGKSTSYLYDADGTLLIQRDDNDTTLYLPGQELHLDPHTKAQTGKRFVGTPSGAVAVLSSNGTLDYEFTTPQNTGAIDIDATTLNVQRRYYDPYGNLRNPAGTAPTNWPDAHGYLGRPQDTTTGLDLLGARQYDSRAGRFLSVDPVFEPGDPGQSGGYSYGADDPVDSADPTGLAACNAACQIRQDDDATAKEVAYDQSRANQAEQKDEDKCHSNNCFSQTRKNWSNSDYAAQQLKEADEAQAAEAHREELYKQRAAAAAAAAAAAKKKHHGVFGALKSAASFAYHASGAADVVGCVTDPSVGGCIQAAITVGSVIGTGGESVAAEAAVYLGENLIKHEATTAAE
ncbi:RHS repeat domain-containing protein, partial [Kitasatospora sp. NPDC058965]|uniref:RHS repeat domain-containing protein n=1 Tax=Kitasatospora sp. NPDC058965 TaxID=3346682 RepID=UPI0036C3699E